MLIPSSSSSSPGENTPVEADSDIGGAPNTARSFVALALGAEVLLGATGWVLGTWRGLAWIPMLRVDPDGVALGVLGGIGLVGVHLILIVPGRSRNPLYRSIYLPLRRALASRMKQMRLGDLVLLALASGLGEELFFRGWLQTETNIVVASVLFGACHVWGREGLPYGLYATAMGFGLGGLFAHTGQNLWAPAVAHTVNNLLGFLALRYNWLPSPGS